MIRTKSFAIETNGNTLRTKSWKMTVSAATYRSQDSVNNITEIQEEEEDLITIEVPWDSIKIRFHLFFSLSIVMLSVSAVFSIVLKCTQGFDIEDHYHNITKVFFSTQTILGAIGVLVYIVAFEDNII